MTHEQLKTRLGEIAQALSIGRSEADRPSEAILGLMPLIESLSERIEKLERAKATTGPAA